MDTIRIRGTRRIIRESGDSELTILMEGVVNRKDISKDGLVDSGSIADMVLEIQGLPEKKSRGLPMKTVPGEEEGSTKPSAELSEEERQRILLDYINRILGESRDL
jgi:flagellar L-ring protein precursor FlgH